MQSLSACARNTNCAMTARYMRRSGLREPGTGRLLRFPPDSGPPCAPGRPACTLWTEMSRTGMSAGRQPPGNGFAETAARRLSAGSATATGHSAFTAGPAGRRRACGTALAPAVPTGTAPLASALTGRAADGRRRARCWKRAAAVGLLGPLLLCAAELREENPPHPRRPRIITGTGQAETSTPAPHAMPGRPAAIPHTPRSQDRRGRNVPVRCWRGSAHAGAGPVSGTPPRTVNSEVKQCHSALSSSWFSPV